MTFSESSNMFFPRIFFFLSFNRLHRWAQSTLFRIRRRANLLRFILFSDFLSFSLSLSVAFSLPRDFFTSTAKKPLATESVRCEKKNIIRRTHTLQRLLTKETKRKKRMTRRGERGEKNRTACLIAIDTKPVHLRIYVYAILSV